jgi:hypothetical protein
MDLRGLDQLQQGLNAKPPYARLSGEAIHPLGARPRKCVIIIVSTRQMIGDMHTITLDEGRSGPCRYQERDRIELARADKAHIDLVNTPQASDTIRSSAQAKSSSDRSGKSDLRRRPAGVHENAGS